MRRTLILLLILTAGSALAADPPKANSLTPTEVMNNWVSLFDGETTFGWKIDGQAQVKAGVLTLGGEKATSATFTTSFQDFTVEFEYQAQRKDEWPTFLLSNPQIFEMVKARKKYKAYPFDVSLETDTDWHVGRYEVRGSQHEASAGAMHGMSGAEIVPLAPAFNVPSGGTVRIRNIKLKPHGLSLIFNGKDLTGWKKYTGDEKRSKSDFTVTPEGWINVKNGPGDLQTEKQWGDFVFQGECISNGPGLNSGVFFRCLPGQYQQGYEFQIQNGFKDNDRTKPADFGTGGIYRRVPARKVVPNDHEWFMMTLIAQGNHIATWVNGYQTVDWSDTRPANDNARNGCKLGPGPISLQGHDKTTDLSFRNLRIAELKK